MKTPSSPVIIAIFILMSTPSIAFSPAGNEDPDKYAPSLTVFIGSNYGSNYFYLGQSYSGNKPYYSSELTLMLKSGIWFSGSLYHLTQYQPFIGTYDISVGWQRDFNKWLDGGVSVSRLVYPSAMEDGSNLDFTYYHLQSGLDLKFLYTSISAGILVVEESEFYLQLKNSRYFQTGKFLNESAYFTFDPGISFLAGAISERLVSAGIEGIRGRGRRQTATTTTYSEQKSFKWLDMELSLPVGFTWKSISIEPCLTYYYPLNLPDEVLSNKGIYFYLSLYLKI